MTNQHPITPPPELVGQWTKEWLDSNWIGKDTYIATQAARWGADMELKACCEWFVGDWTDWTSIETVDMLRAARRPKPPSLKELALAALEQVDECAVANMSQLAIHDDLVTGVDTIRRALEALPE